MSQKNCFKILTYPQAIDKKTFLNSNELSFLKPFLLLFRCANMFHGGNYLL